MRLDKYLKVSRIIKRRTVANEACDAGRVIVNGKQARASYEVQIGDIIETHFGDKILKVEVLNIQENVRKESAQDLYRTLSDERSKENNKFSDELGNKSSIQKNNINPDNINYNWINNE